VKILCKVGNLAWQLLGQILGVREDTEELLPRISILREPGRGEEREGGLGLCTRGRMFGPATIEGDKCARQGREEGFFFHEPRPAGRDSRLLLLLFFSSSSLGNELGRESLSSS